MNTAGTSWDAKGGVLPGGQDSQKLQGYSENGGGGLLLAPCRGREGRPMFGLWSFSTHVEEILLQNEDPEVVLPALPLP